MNISTLQHSPSPFASLIFADSRERDLQQQEIKIKINFKRSNPCFLSFSLIWFDPA